MWLTEAEAAAELRVSLNTLRRRRKVDGLPHVRLGRRVLYDRDELEQYLREHANNNKASADKEDVNYFSGEEK